MDAISEPIVSIPQSLRFRPLVLRDIGVLCFLLLSLPGPAAGEPGCPVTLIAQGVSGSPGSVGFVVFGSRDGWPENHEKAAGRQAAPAQAGAVAVTLALVPGRYAVAVVHDENGNRKLDRRPSGRPREGWGMSNNPKATLKTPGFDAAGLTVACGARVEILMRYPGKRD